MTAAARPSVPNSEAVSRGYNFASTWEQVLFLSICDSIIGWVLTQCFFLIGQNAPLTEQQQEAILALSHVVPFPLKLENTFRENNGLSISTKSGTADESVEINSALVNTNQLVQAVVSALSFDFLEKPEYDI
ncbi:hypothetical protein R6Q57_006112 [Mikania cordata]